MVVVGNSVCVNGVNRVFVFILFQHVLSAYDALISHISPLKVKDTFTSKYKLYSKYNYYSILLILILNIARGTIFFYVHVIPLYFSLMNKVSTSQMLLFEVEIFVLTLLM